MAKSKFYEEIKSSLIEREVEDVYNKGINLYFPEVAITHPFACDGFIDTITGNHKILKLIIEYKLDEVLKSNTGKAKVLVQVLYYMKRFEQNGLVLPNVCMVGDINECFVLHTNPLLPYLDENVNWEIAPSEAHKYNPELVAKIANNDDINPFVFEINETFSFKEVSEKIINLADNIQRYVRVTEHNISNIYDYFVKNVIKDVKKIAPNDLVSIFMGVITDKDNYYKHPSKSNTLVTPSKEVNINGKGFDSFFSYFDRTYTPQEKNKFTEISDRLIEDTKRRNTGEFYTPTLFVDYAHNMLTKKFGEDWKEKFVVWDNCCGTKNLTRDYYFKELYCSTLENAELEISSRYNKEATSFQFDFLNDSLDKLPEGLIKAFEENKPIIFLINPPYATSASGVGMDGKKGVSNTKIYEEMITNKMGSCSQNLYAQFLYRIMMIKKQYNLTNVHIALFCKPNYISGGSYKDFRKEFFKNFIYSNGVLFNASEFADVSDKWGINFTIWNCGEELNKKDFIHNLIHNEDGKIIVDGKKNVYNVDGEKKASDWLREELKQSIAKKIVFPHFSSTLKPNDKDNQTLLEGSLGGFCSLSNNICENAQGVIFTSAIQTKGTACITNSVIPSNFTKCTALFSARKLIVGNWINDKDEYLAPNEEHPAYKEFENDSIIYSLFHSASNQSSLRNVEYKGKNWDIKNEFFFMGKDEIAELANANYNDYCYEDCRKSNERYVYTLLNNITLSPEAQAVLDYARELVRKSFQYRNLFDDEHPEYQINNWDIGFYQLKSLWKEFAPNEYNEFKKLYKKLSDKMRPMVYELGFLK